MYFRLVNYSYQIPGWVGNTDRCRLNYVTKENVNPCKKLLEKSNIRMYFCPTEKMCNQPLLYRVD